MSIRPTVATILIAACAYSAGAGAQNVYRCGSSYSQVPCPDGAEVKAQDPRSAEQKRASDARIRHDLGVANGLEKARQKEEEHLRAERAKVAAAETKAQAAQAKASQAAAADTTKPAKSKHHAKKAEPEYFTARGAAPEKPKPAASGAKP